MELSFIEWIGLISGAITIILFLQTFLSFFLKKTPWVKRIYFWIINKKYKVQLMGVKKYKSFDPDMEKIKKEILKKYIPIREISIGENYFTVLIENMQAPYKIVISPEIDPNTENEFIETIIETVVNITLEGSINFGYKTTDENDKFLNVMDDLFDIIECIENEKPNYSLFSIKADGKNEFEKQPFIDEYSIEECEDTKIEIDKSLNQLKINSDSIKNIYKCLKKNISKIL